MRGKQKRARIEAAWLFAPIWAGDATELGKSVWRCRLGWLDAGAWIGGGDEGGALQRVRRAVRVNCSLVRVNGRRRAVCD